MKSAISYGALAAGALLSCTDARAEPPPAPQLPPNENAAVVYIYRVSRLSFIAVTSTVLVDGVKASTLRNNGCTVLRVPAGSHELKIGWVQSAISRMPSVALQANLEPAKIYYYKFDPVISGGIYFGADNNNYHINLSRMENDKAETEMAKCHFTQPNPEFDVNSSPSAGRQ